MLADRPDRTFRNASDMCDYYSRNLIFLQEPYVLCIFLAVLAHCQSLQERL